MENVLDRRLQRGGAEGRTLLRRHIPANSLGMRVVLLAAMLSNLAGCGSFGRSPSSDPDGRGFFGWHIYAPFDTSEIKTVAVFFKTNSFRRDIEKQLTEAVIKEINLRTPFKVVADHTKADSLLSGTIITAGKNLVVEAPTNFARELNMTINVQVKWTRNPPTEIEDQQLPTMITETINFVPEVGDSTLTATNHVVISLAKQIVDMMEKPWNDENDVR
jgi:Lipopolysaccharide-assembly